MGIVNILLIGVIIVAVIVGWIKTVGRYSGYFNRMIGMLLFAVLAYITVVSTIAVAFRGATSIDEIIAMLL